MKYHNAHKDSKDDLPRKKKQEAYNKVNIIKNPKHFSLFADMDSEIEFPMRIIEEAHFKTLSSENSDEKLKISLDTERPTQVEMDTSMENTLSNSQILLTDYSLSSQNYIAKKGKKQVICSLMQQLRKKLNSKFVSYHVLTF